MNSELKTALFNAEAVAYMHGYAELIIPLADLARGQDAHIEELRAALNTLPELPDDYHPHNVDAVEAFVESVEMWRAQSLALLKKTPHPLTP